MTLLIVGFYILIYILFSIPAFTNAAKDIACAELSSFLGGEVKIGQFNIYPFNEVNITGLEVYDPLGVKCLEVEKIGAGISIWKLITERKIELTYGEIIGLEGRVVQPEEGSPLNIDFIIKAFEPKEKKEKAPFELALRNVVLRKSALSFSRPWLEGKRIGSLDLSHLRVINLAADISFPKLGNEGLEIDLRRLSMTIPGATTIEKIGLKGEFSQERISAKDIIIQLPNSQLYIPSIMVESEEGEGLKNALANKIHNLEVTDSYITPADFSFLFEPLDQLTEAWPLEIAANGNPSGITIEEFQLGSADLILLTFRGGVENLMDPKNVSGDISDFRLFVSQQGLNKISNLSRSFIAHPSPILADLLHASGKLGGIEFSGDCAAAMANKSVKGGFNISSNLFDITIEGGGEEKKNGHFSGQGEINLSDVRIQELLPKIPLENLNANIIAEGDLINGNPQGMISLVVEDFELNRKTYEGFSLNLSKEGEDFDGDLMFHNAIADIEARFAGDIEGEEKDLKLDMDFQRVDLSEVIDMKKYTDYLLSGNLNLDLAAVGTSELTGELNLNNFSFASSDGSRSLRLKQLRMDASREDSLQRINLASDWLDISVESTYPVKDLVAQLKEMGYRVMPALLTPPEEQPVVSGVNRPEVGNGIMEARTLDFDIHIKRNNSVPEFFNLPVRLLVPINIYGNVSEESNSANLSVDIPYLQQGKSKLIYDTRLTATLEGNSGAFNALIETTVPVKKGDLALNFNLWARDNELTTDLHWINTENSDFKGHLNLDTRFRRNELSKLPEIALQIRPSILQMGTADWHLAKSNITYADNRVEIRGFRISHDEQFVEIEGVASPDYEDVVTLKLADIDVDYVFDMLAINYVTFGGTATGEITGHSLLSGDPVAETESLVIKDFTYNGAPLGVCVASSRWNNEEKEIEIGAKISQEGRLTVNGSGGIWLGRDSLSFDLEARKVPVDFVQPFMAVFSSHVGGYATGDVKLFGTFHDIDMTGKIFADSVAVKLDYTNTVYHGSDSVYLNPGRIEIPHFRLYDKFGNSAMLTGELTHRYFHDPSFNFRLSDAQNFLCYDTSSDLNPDWYGTLFGSGAAQLNGVPGITDISADMTVGGNSNFTFVLNDTEYARDYQFLTFSDRRAEEAKKNQELTANDIKEMLRRNMQQDEGGLSKFSIDIRATVTPQVLFTLVMDPAAGDKITARGRGAMQVKYESDDDEMMMYGKYEIDEGNYNFSLQDIILRDFKIKEGSSIAFNGNPLAADLDISATYRVNTNLSDLDKSFSTDRDLNRTNVPVDAVLSVDGNMTSPNITFDIELPTLTQDVERKVKSIISTDDMMNRQIIYLLALNRFYTPEYMGATGNGGELAAVASSTISSQLSNILGQLTDKFSVSPSFRSDKGDFSDIEVDVALSSKLLNNRLLINGNFGYRDRSNSSTTFVGDFDVEYLLSKNGNLRLKAYNHFNDQNYYLREALTTQGIGVVYRKDFDDLFKFLKKKKQTTDNE